MDSRLLAKDGQAMNQALSALDSHQSEMRKAGNTAIRIKDEIAANYVAGSSSAFQSRVDDWVSNYTTLLGKFDALQQALGGANSSIDGAEDIATHTGGHWGPTADTTYGTLMGH
jgi:uncharacterized protein YukE